MKMTEKGVEQKKSLARCMLIIAFLCFAYSAFEVVRHTVLGDEPEHIMGHLAVGLVFGAILLSCKQAAYELFVGVLQ